MTDAGEHRCEISVSGAELSATLKRLHKLGGRTPGPGVWRIDDGALSVEWKGGTEELDGSGDGTLAFRVGAKQMEVLAKTTAKTGEVHVRLRDGDRVAFNTFSVPYEPVDDGPTNLLPVRADRRAVLMLAYTHDEATIQNAGVAADVEAAREKLREDVQGAADKLAWSGIDAAHLGSWVDAHLRAVASGKPSFEIAREQSDGGQLDLFS